MSETKWTKWICADLKKYWDVVPLVGGQMQRPGLPDRMLIGHGRVIYIEFKGPKTKLALHQEILLWQWTYERRIPALIARRHPVGKSGDLMMLGRADREEKAIAAFANGDALHTILMRSTE